MKKIWHIGFNDIRLMVRDKAFFFWSLVFPLVFILIFGNLYKGQGGSSKAALKIINQDKGQWGEYFIEKLQSPGIDIQVIEEEPDKYNRILIIAKDFSEKIQNKEAQKLFFKKRSGANLKAAAHVESKIIQAIAKIITELILHGSSDLSHFFENKPDFKNIIEVKSKFPENTIKKIPRGFDHVIPGIIVQFIMMMVLIYGGVSIKMDRKRGVLNRILYSKVSIPELWSAKFLGRLLMGVLQASILIVTGLLFFNLNLGIEVLFFLNVIVFSIAMAALSIFIGSVFRKEDLIVGISVLLANVFSALGGCWWPIEVVPQSFKTIGMISPAYWAMDSFHQIIFFNKGWENIYINILLLLGFAGVFTCLAIKYFKIKD